VKKLKYILIGLLLIFGISTFYSQDIEKEVDDFTGDTIWTLKSSNLSGGSFFGKTHCNLTLVYYSNKTLFMKLQTVTPTIFSIKQALLGASLFIKTDIKINELLDNGQNSFENGKDFSISRAVYVVSFDLIKEIIDSKEPKVRIKSIDETYLDFYFGEDNLKEYKKFYKKFNK